MRRAAVIGLILLLAIAGFIVRPSPAQTPTTETITLKDGGKGHFRSLDSTHPEEDNAGDVRVASYALIDPTTHDRVGTDRFVCTVQFGHVHGSGNTLCAVELKINGRGRIEAQGNIHVGDQFDVLGITGGTGDFSDVAGTVDRTGAVTVTITINLIYH